MLDLANVVAAALTTRDERAPTARIVELARTGEITTLFSSESLEECREVLLRPRLRKHHSLSEAEVDAVLAGVVAHGIRVEPALDTIEGPDPNDAHLWRMLRMRPDAVLITGDKALRTHSPAWAHVMTPREWIDARDQDV